MTDVFNCNKAVSSPSKQVPFAVKYMLLGAITIGVLTMIGTLLLEIPKIKQQTELKKVQLRSEGCKLIEVISPSSALASTQYRYYCQKTKMTYTTVLKVEGL